MNNRKTMNNGKKEKKLRVIIILAVIALLGATGVLGYRLFFAGTEERDVTYRVRRETYLNVIEIAGTIAAAKEQNLQAAGAGIVTAVYVKEGDSVRKGQVILRLDDSEQRYNLERHDFDMAQKRISSSPREIELLMRQREVLEQRLKDRQVIANFNGVIAQFSIAVGDVVEAKDSAGVILDRSYLKATVEVVETDAPKLRPGQKVTLNFPALNAAGENPEREGYVHSFPAVATKSSRGASVVRAEIRIDDPPDIILPNYSFTGEIEISPPVTMLLVERLAIGYERPAGDGRGPPDNAPGSGPRPGTGEDQRPSNGPGNVLGSGQGQMPDNTPGNGPRPGTGEGQRPSNGPGLGSGQGQVPDNAPGSGARPGPGAAYAERIRPDGSLERVSVRVEPYGQEFVSVIEGLAEGDEVKGQVRAPRSGQNQQSSRGTGSRQQTPGMPTIRIGGSGGGGPGGRPPGGGG